MFHSDSLLYCINFEHKHSKLSFKEFIQRQWKMIRRNWSSSICSNGRSIWWLGTFVTPFKQMTILITPIISRFLLSLNLNSSFSPLVISSIPFLSHLLTNPKRKSTFNLSFTNVSKTLKIIKICLFFSTPSNNSQNYATNKAPKFSPINTYHSLSIKPYQLKLELLIKNTLLFKHHQQKASNQLPKT